MKTRHSRSAAALERWQHLEQKRMSKKNATPKFGVSPYVVPKVIDGGKMPTKLEWIEAQQHSASKKLTSGEMVKTAADPDKIREYREKFRQRSQRSG